MRFTHAREMGRRGGWTKIRGGLKVKEEGLLLCRNKGSLVVRESL